MPAMKQRSLFFDQPLTDGDILSVCETKRWLTYREIAVRLERAKSPSLIARVKGLVATGALDWRTKKLPNGVDMFQFRLSVQNTREGHND